MKNKLKSNENYIILIIALLEIITNLIISILNKGRVSSINQISSELILGVSHALLCISLMKISIKPIVSILMLLASKISLFIYELLDGATLKEATEDLSLTIAIIVIGILIQILLSDKKLYKEKTKDSVMTRLKNDILIERSLLHVNNITKLIILGIVITTIMKIANGNLMYTIGDSEYIRVYGAISLVIPIILVLSILTTSELVIYTMLFKIAAEIYTIYNLIYINEIGINQYMYVIYIAIEMFITYYINITNNEKGR